jgi:hypothetical protein
MGNGISLYHITKGYIDGCTFERNLEDTGLENFCLNNLDLLKNFFNYFKRTGRDIINVCANTKTIGLSLHEK